MQKIEKGELESRLRATREQLLAAIEGIPASVLKTDIAFDELTVAQLLIFLAAWEKEFAFGLREIQRHKKPTQLLRVLDEPEQFRAEALEVSSLETLEEILIELEDARFQLEDRIRPFSERDLNENKRFRWLGNRALWPFIADNTIEYELQYIPAVEAFAQRWHHENS